MEIFLIFVIIFSSCQISFQVPVVQVCPPCAVLCNGGYSTGYRLRNKCTNCQCETKTGLPQLVPVVFCPFKICNKSCGFMGYKQDKIGCNSCECQEI